MPAPLPLRRSRELRLRRYCPILAGTALLAFTSPASGLRPAAGFPADYDTSAQYAATAQQVAVQEVVDVTAVRTLAQAQVLLTVEAKERTMLQRRNGRPQDLVPTVSTNPAGLPAVVQCIKNHESGNYTEHSHPGSGSGAYQMIPGTWAAWSARAGYPGYRYAYQAPPNVQDAVLQYTLTHGGAGNWSPRYGNDPCTVGMGG